MDANTNAAPVIITATGEERDIGLRRFYFCLVVEFKGEGVDAEATVIDSGDVRLEGTYPRAFYDALVEIAEHTLTDKNVSEYQCEGRSVFVSRWSVQPDGTAEWIDDGEPAAAAALAA